MPKSRRSIKRIKKPSRVNVSGSEAHLQRILTDTDAALTAKYRAGQKEHGGQLWKKSGMMARLLEEHLDALVYAHTLREQLRAILDDLWCDCPSAEPARQALERILDEAPDA